VKGAAYTGFRGQGKLDARSEKLLVWVAEEGSNGRDGSCRPLDRSCLALAFEAFILEVVVARAPATVVQTELVEPFITEAPAGADQVTTLLSPSDMGNGVHRLGGHIAARTGGWMPEFDRA
jgi:hypothetical protein